MSALLQLDELTSGYGAVEAVRGVNLEVHEGEVVGLLGPNGAGKTTTLLTTSGLLKPFKGSVKYDGKDIAGKRPNKVARLGLGHVPEDKSLFHQLTVRENLQLGARPGSVDSAKVMGWFPELEPLIARKSGLLSGGEQQMLAVARALIGNPRLLLIDEMSMGLAPIIVERLFQMLGEIQRDTGLSVLVVEQHVGTALQACERVYVLNHGEMTFDGTAETLRQDPTLLEEAYMGGTSIK